MLVLESPQAKVLVVMRFLYSSVELNVVSQTKLIADEVDIAFRLGLWCKLLCADQSELLFDIGLSELTSPIPFIE